MQVGSAETHRLSAISNIENALGANEFTHEQRQRLERLLRILQDAQGHSPERKMIVIEHNVIPALIGMGLVKSQDEPPPPK